MTELNQENELRYYEVDLTYTAEAKMVLLGKDEEDIKQSLVTDFPHIPDIKIISIGFADEELVKQAKQQREWYDSVQSQQKAQLN